MLKKIKQRFKPAVLTEEQIINLFKVPYDKCGEWNDKFRNADEKTFNKMTRFKRTHLVDNRIDGLIRKFTLAETSDEDFVDEARSVKNLSRGKILEIKRLYGDAGFQITTKDGVMEVFKVYRYYSNILEPMPTLDKSERDGQCHWHALEFSTLLSLSGIPNELVSGYVYEYIKDAEYSHSWVEFKSEKGTDLVFDGNRGAIITKDGYYKIKHPKNISRISHKDVVCEQTILQQLEKIAGGWTNKLWFHDREMALKVYEKYYGKRFVPKSYDECTNNPSVITQLDDVNKEEVPQRES